MKIMLLSDGTGETAALVTRAALAQFEAHGAAFTRYKNIRTQSQVDAIFEESALQFDLIVYTIVTGELRDYINSRCAEIDVPSVDLIGPLLSKMAASFKQMPVSKPGTLHEVNDSYFNRIEAMEFTVRADDGKNSKLFHKADIVLLGVSRTSKTPLSIYLSHHGWKVANLPLVAGIELPSEIYQVDQRKIVGLTIDPQALYEIRKARLEKLGSLSSGEYADMPHILEEIEFANNIFSKNKRWPVFNVTHKALEETAAEIIRVMESRRINSP